MEQGRETVLLVTDNNPQSLLFVEYIHRMLHNAVYIIAPSAISEAESFTEPEPERPRTVVLLDCDHVTEASMQTWQSQYHNRPQWVLTAFNLKDEDHATELMSFMHLAGVFYRSDSLELICKGIQCLMAGDIWMSRALMSRLIDFYRRQQLNSYRPTCGITQRELEIIGLLGSGASNTEIADLLFVSEHTVKSHLYNIFRKINVHNRIQAVNWARQNLGPPPPVAIRDAKTTPKN